MSPELFRDLVCKMRFAQKAYFSGRRTEDLQESKRLEALVDRELAEKSLFESGEGKA